jgi:hypothetical protein
VEDRDLGEVWKVRNDAENQDNKDTKNTKDNRNDQDKHTHVYTYISS